jgi:zinc ribbon protein
MIVIAGWGKRGKELAYIGLAKCSNCKNYGHFKVFELSDRVTLFFVPVAKFNAKTYLVCEICDCGFEVDGDGRAEILRDSATVPDRDTVGAIWNELDREIAQYQKDEAQGTEAIDAAIESLKARFPPETVDYVRAWYANFLTDEDRPK